MKTVRKTFITKMPSFKIFDLWSIILIIFLLPAVISTKFPGLGIDLGGKPTSYIVFFLITCFICLYLMQQIQNFSKKGFDRTLSIFISFGLLIAATYFFTLFYFIRDIEAPILHDVYDHAMMAKSIVTENGINFFYSPLLHVMSALTSVGNIWRIPQLIIFFTHLAVFLIPLLYSSLFYYFVKNGKLSIVLYIVFTSLHFPAMLYYTAGKNSLILALSIIPVCIFSLNEFFNHRTILNLLRVTVSFILLFMAHYPTFGILCFFIFPWVILHIGKLFSRRQFRAVVVTSLPFVLSISFSLAWFIPLYWIADKLITESVTAPENIRVATTLSFIISNSESAFNDFVDRYFSFFHIIFLIPLIVFPKNLVNKISLVWIYLSLPVLYSLITALQMTRLLGMVPNTLEIIYPNIINYFLLFIFFYLLSLLKITNKSLVALLIFVSFFSILSHHFLYQNLTRQHIAYNVITEDDLKAFEYINTNIPPNTMFLNSGNESSRKGTIFPVDGALWIPLYTDSKVFIDFRQFSSKQTNKNYELFKRLRNETDDRELVQYLTEQGITYAYLDKGIFGESLHEDFLNEIPYEIIFSEGTVRIIEFK